MTTDREVIREAEDKKGRFSLFGRKKETTLKRVSRPPGVHSHSIPRTESTSSSTAVADDDLPPRASNDSATSTNEKEIIPKYAGFDFQAIKETIGKEDLDVEKIPVPRPGPGGPGVEPVSTTALARPPQPLERSESAPPPTNSLYGSITAIEPPDTPTLPIGQFPRDSTAEISPALLRSLSLDDLPKNENQKNSVSSSISPIVPTPHPVHGPFTNTHRQTSTNSDMSTLSFGSAGGDIWASGAPTSTDTQLTFGRADGTIFDGHSNPYGNHPSLTSYRFNNGSANGDEPDALAVATTLTFGGADSSATQAAEDSWKPNPIRSGQKKWTPNPWDS